MTRKEKCELLIERGYTYDSEIGNIYNRYGKIVNTHSNGYVQIGNCVNKKHFNLKAHQFAWYCVYGNCDTEEIDHINGIKDDNRICNLRSVTHQKNLWNRKNDKGYHWNKNANKWKAQITFNNKQIYLGYFNTEQEAKQAYLNAKEKYHII
jgi:5-methylcytosine-specific restriction endonuclease McrA